MTETVVGALSLALGIVLGFLIASLRAARSGAGEVHQAQTQLAVEVARAEVLEQRVVEVARAAEVREQQLRGEHDRYIAQVRTDQEGLKQQFKALAADVLESNNKQFLDVAGERMKRAQQLSEAELAKREESVKKLVEPMAKALDEVRRQTTEADKARAAGQSTLSEQVRQMIAASDKLDKRTTDFINTLRRSDVRGNWGEVQLRRVVELAGMVQHVDFEEQQTVRNSDGQILRPDMTVKLAGGRTIVVDSKVALSALLEAFETEDEAVRAERLLAHARQVKKHVDDLSGKKYWDQFPSTPEFVVMFVPSEAFYQSALEQDPALQEYAFNKQVVIATPTTLVAMLRTVAHAWREDTLARNAQQVLAAGKDLYERLGVMGGHLAKVGKALDGASKAYNATVGSMEARVMVSARKFADMQAIEAQLPVLAPVEVDVRQLVSHELSEAQPSSAAPDNPGDLPRLDGADASDASATTGSTGESADSATTGTTGESADSATTGTTGESADSAATGSTGESADSAATGSTGESADSATTGSTGNFADSTTPGP